MSYISVAAPSSEKSNVAGSRRRPLESSRAVEEEKKGVLDSDGGEGGKLDIPVMVEISDKSGVANRAKEK